MRLYVKEDSVLRTRVRELRGVGTLTYILYEEYGLRGCPTEYGIEIRKQSSEGEEVRRIHSITTDRSFASRIFRAIVLGEVTPCTLEDVVLDAIAQAEP